MEQPGSQPDERITREGVQKAEQQAEASYIKIMDDWEASVPENGQFFIKVGSKVMPNDPASYVDTRALILREGKPTVSLAERQATAIVEGDNTDSEETLGVPDFLLKKIPVTPEYPKQYIAMTRKGPKTITLSGKDFEKLSGLHSDEKGGFSGASNNIRWGGKAHLIIPILPTTMQVKNYTMKH
ncbi:MAG: hypothetical protein AAB583_05255 [Patescibacteria group bacterium]